MNALTLLLRLCLPHLRKAPLRSSLVVLGIALGVAVVVASRATSDALERTFDDLVDRVGDRAQWVIVGNQSGVPSALVAEAAAIPGVAHAAPALEVPTSFASDGEPLLILGVDFLGDTHFLPFRSDDGGTEIVDDPLSFVNDPNAVLVSRSLAKRRKLSEGDTLEVLAAGGTRKLRVRGILEDKGPAASLGGQVAVMFLDAAQVTFGRGTLVDRIDLALVERTEKARTLAALRALLQGAARLERPDQFGQRARSLTEPLSDGMQLSATLALLVAAFIIYNAVAVSVAQRRREIGVLRALGVLRREVIMLFSLEAVVLALLGVLVGIALAHELVAYTHAETRFAINRVYGAMPPPPVIEQGHVVRGVLAALVIAVVGAIWPARRGARLDPVAALSSSSAISSSRQLRSGRLALFGVTLILAAQPVAQTGSMAAGYVATIANMVGAALCMPLAIVVLRRALLPAVHRLAGISGRLGLDYVERNLGRSTMNVLALMVAVALSLGISGWLRSFQSAVLAWFEQVSAADLTITAGSPLADRRRMPLAPDVLERLEGVPGVLEVQPIRMIDQAFGRDTFSLLASDTRAYLGQAARRGKPWNVLSGKSPIATGELYEAPRIVLGQNAANRLGLTAGDRMRLETPSGTMDFEVRAVVVDYSSELGAGFIDQRYYVRGWGDTAIDVVNLYLAKDADASAVAKQVRARLGGGKALFVTQTQALRDEFLRAADEGFSYARAIELIVLLIALMGVVGTLVAAVLDRTRELGMLRAVGATRGQIVRAVVLEAAFLGICAIVGGVASGSIQCELLLRTVVAQNSGWHLDFVFPVANVARFSLLVLATSAAAGLLPGLRAATLDAKTALASE